MASAATYKTFDRVDAVYSNESEKFVLQDRAFQRQYAHVYAARLWTLRPKLEQAARDKWGSDVPIRRLLLI
jgi:DNA polymerase delta subunit 2